MNHSLQIFISTFAAACLIFSGIVVLLFKSGIVSETRNRSGELKREMSFKGLAAIAAFLMFLMLFLYFFNHLLFSDRNSIGLLSVLKWNFLMVMALVIYDSLIIDLIVIGKIRPAFLNLPEEMDWNAMKKHVVKTFTAGWALMLPIIAVPSAVYYFLNRT